MYVSTTLTLLSLTSLLFVLFFSLASNIMKSIAAATAAIATTAAADHETRTSSSSSSSSTGSSIASLDISACCYCHSSLDYSDRAAFFQQDRFEDYHDNNRDTADDDDEASSNASATSSSSSSSSHKSYVFRPNDPYLPTQPLYNPNNALVYCDSCDRLYHQQCHMPPLIVLPRGAWHCLFCQSQQQIKKQQQHLQKSKTTTTKTKNKKHDPLQQFWKDLSSNESSISPNDLFASPPQPAMRPYELAWFAAVSGKMAHTTHALLYSKLPKAIHGQLSTYRLTQAALQTWTSTHKNRQHIAHAASQAAVDTVVQQTACQYKIQLWLQSVEQVRGSSSISSGSGNNINGSQVSLFSSQQSFQTLVEWCRDYAFSINNKNKKKEKQQPKDKTTTKDNMTTTTTKRGPKKTNAAALSMTQQQQVKTDHLPDDFIQRVIFPFGIPDHTWFPPRTPEFATMMSTGSGGNNTNTDTKNSKKVVVHDDDDDDDSGISLDDLTCCVCRTSDATDDNDLLLCDGHGCFRAYHMQCVYPAVTQQDLGEEDDDWFCPLCCGIADLIHLVQSEYMGDEWEQRRIVREIEDDGKNHKKKKATKKKTPGASDINENDNNNDDDSLQSWTRVDQVFPNASWEYETALAWQSGKHNADTNALLAQVFGWEMGDGNEEDEEDDDNVEEDGHFDLEAFHEERRRERDQLKKRSGHRDSGADSNGSDEDDDDESSTPSSQATLVDMSSVELEINKNELAALSEADDSSCSGTEDESDNDGARRSRRLRKQQQQQRESDDGDDSNRDPGKLDEANIISGKRARKPVDYIKLNNAIFGDLSDGEAANLDDVEDFQQLKRTSASSDNDEDNDEEEGDSSHDDEDDGNNELSRTSGRRDDERDDSDGNEAKIKSKKKVFAKTAVTRSKKSSKSFNDNHLTKETTNDKKRGVSNSSARSRSSKRQKIQPKTVVNDRSSTKPKKTTNDVQRKESKNGVRNARGTSIAQKALNFVSSWVSSPVRKAS